MDAFNRDNMLYFQPKRWPAKESGYERQGRREQRFKKKEEIQNNLIKYLSPMKRVYRIAHKDQSEHQRQLKHLKMPFTGEDHD